MSLQEFDIRSDETPDKALIEQDFERFYYNVLPFLLPEQAKKILIRVNSLELLPTGSFNPEDEYGANFDLKKQVQMLIDAVGAMKDTVMPGGRMREDVTPREMKEVVSSASQLMNLLMKYHRELMSMDRMRILEQCTVEVLQGLGDRHGEEIVTEFAKMMEERLEHTE